MCSDWSRFQTAVINASGSSEQQLEEQPAVSIRHIPSGVSLVMMNRRTFNRRLASVAAAGVLTGCTSAEEPSTRTATQADSDAGNSTSKTQSSLSTDNNTVYLRTGEEYTTQNGWRISISNPHVRKCFVQLEDSRYDDECGTDNQYIIVNVHVSGASATQPAYLDPYLQTTSPDTRSSRLFVVSNASDSNTQTMTFSVPSRGEYESVELVWSSEYYDSKTVHWTVPSEVTDNIDKEPSFSVNSFAVPATSKRGEKITVKAEIANSGSRGDTLLVSWDRNRRHI